MDTIGQNDFLHVYGIQMFVALVILLGILSIFAIKTYRSKLLLERKLEERDLSISQTEAEEHLRLMLDAGPICCQLFNRDLHIIDCNEAAVNLLGFKSKHEYIDRWFYQSFPETQPDGLRSSEKILALVRRAFDGGRCVFDWMHQSTDGTPIPTEVTLVRIKYKDDYVVAAYTRDLREVKELEKQAQKIFYDALTGIYSRRYLDEHLNDLLRTQSRSESTLSLMMIDIDRFKQYNDTYGHDGGDKCLKAVAETLKDNLPRADDFVVRYGGEEFCVVLPNTCEKGARKIAEKLLESMRERNIPHESSDIAPHVTISIGVTTAKVDYTHKGRDFIRRADEMLYASKQSGRNRYTFAALTNS